MRCSLLEGVSTTYEISSWTTYGKQYRVLSRLLWGLVYKKHKSIADRIINPNETSEDASEADDLSGRSLANPSSTDRSSTNPGSKSTGCIADSEAALLRQLFPDTQEKGIFSSSRRDQVLLRFYTHNKKAKITPSPCRTPPNQSNKATPSNVARLTMTPFHNDARWGEPPSAPSWISGTVHFGLIG